MSKKYFEQFGYKDEFDVILENIKDDIIGILVLPIYILIKIILWIIGRFR